ncbi:MAG: ABC transporter ATP-binding protein [Limnochordales bacterium]|nr:sugar ABC transporter ATP-binding protein [Bacillota bacterium]
MAEIRLRGLTKKFGNVTAVDGIDLEIREGELLALLGPSGCGKTTCLLMLAGIYKPTAGEILFDDVVVNDVPPKARNVGLVFQSYALYPHMTVYDNIAFPLRLRGLPKSEIDRRVRDVAKLVQIDDLLDRRPGQLSGGQQQRVALCRALVREPAVLLLDEPLSNLDARLRIETRSEIKRLQAELGITTVLVTHDQIEAMTMADRIAVMRAGRIEQLSEPEELYARPANVFVASFIGDPPMNLLRLEWMVSEGRPRLVSAGGFVLPLPARFRRALERASGRRVVLGIRPEHVEVAPEPGDGALRGTVQMTEVLGRDVLVTVRCRDQVIRALVPGRSRFAAGHAVWIKLPPAALHLFDAETERRLEEEEGAASDLAVAGQAQGA